MRHLLESADLLPAEVDNLINLAVDISENKMKYTDIAKGKKLASIFFEPSTRTRLSFEAAMLELGGNVLSVASMASSSAAKGESIGDTVRVLGSYADIIAMRHPVEGAPYAGARVSEIPIINAGDGAHHHPTQTLADVYTIHREKGRLDNLTVGFCGDLKYGRTVHSLTESLSMREGINFVYISPKLLSMPEDMLRDIPADRGHTYIETEELESVLPSLDVLYMTRVQRERFEDVKIYEEVKDSYILTKSLMSRAKSDCIILHPLPRVNEIEVAVDDDPRACYFKQALGGKLMRMALIIKLLGLDNDKDFIKTEYIVPHIDDHQYVKGDCANKKCITSQEIELPKIVKKSSEGSKHRCIYCD